MRSTRLAMILAALIISAAGEHQAPSDDCWPQLKAAMSRMHEAAAQLRSTGNRDADFVALMVPHHQAAIDMARSELLCGKDPLVRRLAQEILADQQQEIVLMQRWQEKQNLKQSSKSRRD